MHIGVFHDSDIWLSEAKKLGYRIVATHPLDIKEKAYYEQVKPYIDLFYQVSYFDLDKLVKIAKEHNVEMLVCHPASNDAIYATGFVNSALGLKGLSLAAAEKASSKFKFHHFLEENNLPRAPYTYVYDKTLNLNDVSFPCIVKPNFGAGSMGVKKIDSQAELKEFFTKKSAEDGYHLSKKYDYYLVQGYVHARYLLGCNCVVKDGELIIFAHYVRDLKSSVEADRLPYFYFEEALYPEDDPSYLNDDVISKIKIMVKKLGVDNWPVKLDIFLDENKRIISFVEVNLRPGGTHSARAFNLVYGFNNVAEQVKLPTNLSCNFSRRYDSRYKYVMIKNFRFKPGIIKKIEWPKCDSKILYFNSRLKPGTVIPAKWDISVAAVNGELVMVSESKEKLLNEFYNFVNNIVIEYE